jgi:hypothetical protein
MATGTISLAREAISLASPVPAGLAFRHYLIGADSSRPPLRSDIVPGVRFEVHGEGSGGLIDTDTGLAFE